MSVFLIFISISYYDVKKSLNSFKFLSLKKGFYFVNYTFYFRPFRCLPHLTVRWMWPALSNTEQTMSTQSFFFVYAAFLGIGKLWEKTYSMKDSGKHLSVIWWYSSVIKISLAWTFSAFSSFSWMKIKFFSIFILFLGFFETREFSCELTLTFAVIHCQEYIKWTCNDIDRVDI